VAAGLDCSQTCCLVGINADPTQPPQCAEQVTDNDCSIFYTRDVNEFYNGMLSLIGFLVLIPVMIRVVNCMMLVKFCQTFDEMSETWIGGYSVIDCLALPCSRWCYKKQAYEEEDRLAKLEAKKKAEEAQVANDEAREKEEARLEAKRAART